MADRIPNSALQLMLSAYKFGLGHAAERIGAPPERWGEGQIDVAKEDAFLSTNNCKFRRLPYPYPGLRSFTPREGRLFFGRTRNVEEVRRKLEARRVVVVCGGSGSGKSSLLRAGLLPFLNSEQPIEGRDGTWYTVEFRPQVRPMKALVNALVDMILPILQLDRPGLAEVMGLSRDTMRGAGARASLHDLIDGRFEASCREGREAVLDTLLDLAGRQLDQLDRLATGGLRKPNPSLLLLLDQFEEVFRTEVSDNARATLLNLVVDLHARLAAEPKDNGLFLAITMRSEELHRCAEHPGLADVINSSLYLLDLLDPGYPGDRKELRRAIVQPARDVFETWSLPLDDDNPDAPFARGMPDLLLDGMACLPSSLEHRPDQLPLLQHALQATWHNAVRCWSEVFVAGKMELERQHLPGQPAVGATPPSELPAPDLRACLEARADRAAAHAADRFREHAGTTAEEGVPALQAAFRALARRDEAGRWVRRFAEPAQMQAFLDADPALRDVPPDVRWQATCQALHVFLLRGYLNGGGDRPYDISHEALIRTWTKFQDFLREPEAVVYALSRVLEDVDPAAFDSAVRTKKIEAIPERFSEAIALVGKGGRLPEQWGADQINPTLSRQTIGGKWGSDALKAVEDVLRISREAYEARRALAEEARAAEVSAVEHRRQAEIESAERQAKDSRRKAWNFALVSLLVCVCLASVLVTKAIVATRDARAATKDAKVKADADAKIKIAQAIADQASRTASETKAVNRQLGAQGLIGAMQSIQAANSWQPDIRDRAALESLGMLEGRSGGNPELSELHSIATQGWETGVRTLLGTQLTIGKESGSGVDGSPLQCWNTPPQALGKSTFASRNVSHLPGRLHTAVRLDEINNTWALKTYDEDAAGREVSGNLGVLLQPNVRICLSPDASVMTTSSLIDTLPNVFQLYWKRCPDDSDNTSCKPRSSWVVNVQPLTPPPPPPLSPDAAFPKPRTFPCVVGTGDYSSYSSSLPVRQIYFLSLPISQLRNHLPADCHPTDKVDSFTVSYIPSLSQPILTGSYPIKPAPSRHGDCNIIEKTSNAFSVNCTITTPAADKPIPIELSKRDNGYWNVSVGGSKTPPIVVPLFSPLIKTVELDDAGNLIFIDSNYLAWKLILDLNHNRIRPLLASRSCYNTVQDHEKCHFPQDMSVVMSPEEIAAQRP